MALNLEWERRIKITLEAMPARFTTEVGTFDLEGFVTLEQLTPPQARRQAFKPMPVGTRWGGRWQYGWFRGRVKIPREADGAWVMLSCPQGVESYLLVNGEHTGQPYGGRRRLAELSRRARAGDTYDILLEAYHGHGPTQCWAPPARYGAEPWSDVPGPQHVARSTIEVWDEEVFQLYLDASTLWDIRGQLDPDALRVAEIDAALRELTTLVDLELPREAMLKTVRRGRARLKPLLACVNGSTAPCFYCFGHAHLDVAWLWPLQETERKMVRTLSNTLALASWYPEYRYLQSQAHLFWMMKRHYPELYARVKQAVRKGHIVPDGAMWVEADTNISGGEALIRQCLHGKRFFREEFGAESRMLWLPDVFGYSAALPQILHGCGVDYFTTSKIYWTYNGGDPFPLVEFMWQGIDGTEIVAHLHNDYNSRTNPATLMRRWKDRPQKEGFSARLVPFGWGDGGGGPEREHLEYLRRCRDLEGVPRTQLAAPAEFFRDLETRGRPAARYVGELYFQAHRGVYTTQARTKRGNRKSELALREAEFWGAAAAALAGYRYPLPAMDATWKNLLLNQFHDILPGSSIGRVYQEAERAFDEVRAEAGAVAHAATARLVARKTPKTLTVFNSLAWPRTELVPLPPKLAAAALNAPKQKIGKQTFAEVSLPACGWTTLRAGEAPAVAGTLKAAAGLLENEFLRVTFDRFGGITRLYDKETGSELAAGVCNAMAMYRDTPVNFEAWDIDSSYKLMPVDLKDVAEIAVAAQGPLAAVLQLRRKLGKSVLTQDIVLRRGSRRLEFRTVIDWHETRKLLKVRFPVNLQADHALHEIQFGHVQRPNHASRPFDADRFEVSQHKWTALVENGRGVAVLNDCKYGVNVEGGSINLTLLRAPVAPDKHADQGRQEFTYALYVWNGPFLTSGLIREGYALNVPPLAVEGDAGERSLLAVDADNVVVETLKPAEDGSGDWIVRLYESARTATACRLQFGLPVKRVTATNLIEEGGKPVAVKANAVNLTFRPFEIKTFRVVPRT